jgi:hypothetical protein
MGAIICAYESNGSNHTLKIEIMKLTAVKLQNRDKFRGIFSNCPAADLCLKWTGYLLEWMTY